MRRCYLCDFVKDKTNIIWQNDRLCAIFDTCPVSPGHALIVSKRHAVNFSDLTRSEFTDIRDAIRDVIAIIEKTDLEAFYKHLIDVDESDQSVWFCKKALSLLRISKKPAGYNHGFNDGATAGRTVDHFHWHVIPRYRNDTKHTKGGIRFVIPEMGDYMKKRTW